LLLQRKPDPPKSAAFNIGLFALWGAVAAAALVLASCNNAAQAARPLAITSGSPPNGTVGV
jgi:hypothetical protein